MTVLAFLEKLVGPAGGLISLLRRLAKAAPETAPEVNAWIAKLESAVAHNNLIQLAEELPGEAAAILRGQIDPRTHPSDAA